MATDTDNPQGLNLLSLDGGGIIGLSSLFIIREIMDRLQEKAELPNRPRPCDHFDLIAGTGTGAIFAVMLGRLKMSVDDAITSYCRLMSEVQSAKKSIIGGDSRTLRTIRLEQRFKAIVEEVTGDADQMMMEENPNEAKCKVVIYARPTCNMNASLPFAFRSYPANVNVTPDCPIWKALRASTAHPDLSEGIEIEEIGEGYQFTDGSDGCSNPAPLLLEEASVLFPRLSVGLVVSIGARHSSTIQVPQSGWLGRSLSLGGSVTPNALRVAHRIAVNNESVSRDMDVRFWSIGNLYHRLNVDEGVQGIGTNEWEKQSEVGENTRAYLERKEIGDQLDRLVSGIQERPTLAIIQLGGHTIIPSNVASNVAPTNLKYCPCSTPMFRGRQPQIDKANRYFGNEKEAHLVFVIYGPGGTGKTQTALRFAGQTTGRFDGVIFIDASSRQAIESTLCRFAMSENIGNSYMDTLEWLGGPEVRWLMLFDNVDDPDVQVHEYFPRNCKYSVLITTRHEAAVGLARGEGSSCEVAEMVPCDALELLLETAQVRNVIEPTEKAATTRLLKEFRYSALTIMQCGAFIRRTGCSIAQYSKKYSEELATQVMNAENGLNVEDQERMHTAWVLNAKLIHESKPSYQLWRLLIFLHCEGILEQILRRAYENSHNYQEAVPSTDATKKVQGEVKSILRLFAVNAGAWSSRSFASAMGELVSLSLVNYDIANNEYSIHPLLQKWGRATVLNSTSVEMSAFLLALSIDREQRAEDWAFRQALVSHVHEILGLCPIQDSTNLWQFIAVYHAIGRQVEPLVAQVVETRVHVLGHQHPDTLKSMSSLATIYHGQGQIAAAQKLGLHILAGRAKNLGIGHPDTLLSLTQLAAYNQRHMSGNPSMSDVEDIAVALKEALKDDYSSLLQVMSQLAVLYHQQGDPLQAGTLEEKALVVCREHLGDDHPDTLRTLANLAITYESQGRLEEAKDLRTEVVTSSKRLLAGDECLDTLRTAATLAAMWQKRGQLTDAKELQTVVVDVSKRVLGPSHPNTLQSLTNLASTYYSEGLLVDAEALRAQVLAERKQILGDEHPDTLRSMVDLTVTYHEQGRLEDAAKLRVEMAAIYHRQGRLERAETLMTEVLADRKRVLTDRKRVLGEKHPDTLQSMADLATTYHSQHRLKEAGVLRRQVLAARKQVLGDEHPHTLKSMADLAMMYHEQGRLEDAAKLRAEIAAIYHRQGRLEKAETLRVEVLSDRKRVLGDEHPDTLQSMADLATTYHEQGRLEDAVKLRVKLAAIYHRQGRLKKAETLRVEVLSDRKRVLGDEHPDTLQSMAGLATTHHEQDRLEDAAKLRAEIAAIYHRQGRLEKAETLRVEVLSDRKRVLGDEHPDTLQSMADLATTYHEQGRLEDAVKLRVKLAAIYHRQGRQKKAETLRVEVLSDRKRVLGDEHPDTLQSIADLATTRHEQGRLEDAVKLRVKLAAIYHRQGRLEKAETLRVEVLSDRKRVLGDKHPDTLQSMADLATTHHEQDRLEDAAKLRAEIAAIYHRQGRLEKAETLRVEVLSDRKRVLGDEHPDTLQSIADLATTRHEQGRLEDAVKLRVKLAAIYHRQGRLKDAEVLGTQVLAARKRVLGDEHPDTLHTMGNLAATYHKQDRLKDAEVLETQVLAARKRVLGDEHPDTLHTMGNLAATYHKQNRLKDAEVLETQVLAARKRVLGDEHPDTLHAMGNLAVTYYQQDRLKDAEVLETQVLAARKRVLGDEHPDTLLAMENLAATYHKQNRLKDAEVLRTQVLDARKRVLGDEHPDTLKAMAILAATKK